jgi:flavin reductase ActVB
LTASAFSAVSAEPPLVLVCVEKSADCYGAFMATTHLAISVLSERQADTAKRFATKHIDKFRGIEIQAGGRTGMALVRGASAHIECAVMERIDGGDHTIIIGLVLAAANTADPPLLHARRRFGRFVDQIA